VVNWASYNESLVKRGEVILDFHVIDGWYDELERMNQGKRGAAYDYPDSFVQLRVRRQPLKAGTVVCIFRWGKSKALFIKSLIFSYHTSSYY
jgi:hypothetical protein